MTTFISQDVYLNNVSLTGITDYPNYNAPFSTVVYITGTTAIYQPVYNGTTVRRFNNHIAMTDTLPKAGDFYFPNGWTIWIDNSDTTTVTITPVSSTINGNATLVLAAGATTKIVSDGDNYFALLTAGGGGGGVSSFNGDIGAITLINGINTTVVNNGGGSFQINTGIEDGFNVIAYGATGNGTTNDVAAINAAITAANAAGGGRVIFPNLGGTTYAIGSAILLANSVDLYGVGLPTIKLLNASNCAIIDTPNHATGGNVADVIIEGLVLDGNYVNQSTISILSQNGINFYGENLQVLNCRLQNIIGNGIYTIQVNTSLANKRVENTIRRIKMQNIGANGLYTTSDSANYSDIIVVDASQQGDGLYNGFYVGNDGRYWDCHAWGSNPSVPTALPRMAYACYDVSGSSSFVACHFESSKQCVYTNGSIFQGCHFYSPLNYVAGTALVDIVSFNAIIDGCYFTALESGASVPMYAIMMNGGRNQIVNCTFNEFNQYGIVNLVSDSYNIYEGGGFNSFGIGLLGSGTIASTSSARIIIGATMYATFTYFKTYLNSTGSPTNALIVVGNSSTAAVNVTAAAGQTSITSVGGISVSNPASDSVATLSLNGTNTTNNTLAVTGNTHATAVNITAGSGQVGLTSTATVGNRAITTTGAVTITSNTSDTVAALTVNAANTSSNALAITGGSSTTAVTIAGVATHLGLSSTGGFNISNPSSDTLATLTLNATNTSSNALNIAGGTGAPTVNIVGGSGQNGISIGTITAGHLGISCSGAVNISNPVSDTLSTLVLNATNTSNNALFITGGTGNVAVQVTAGTGRGGIYSTCAAGQQAISTGGAMTVTSNISDTVAALTINGSTTSSNALAITGGSTATAVTITGVATHLGLSSTGGFNISNPSSDTLATLTLNATNTSSNALNITGGSGAPTVNILGGSGQNGISIGNITAGHLGISCSGAVNLSNPASDTLSTLVLNASNTSNNALFVSGGTGNVAVQVSAGAGHGGIYSSCAAGQQAISTGGAMTITANSSDSIITLYVNGANSSGTALSIAGSTGSPAMQISAGTGQPAISVNNYSLVDKFGHLVSLGTTPGIAAGAGAGTGPTVSVNGTDTSGTISVTAGTTPSTSSTIVTITFANAFSNAPFTNLIPTNSNAFLLQATSTTFVSWTTNTNTLVLTSGSAALTNAVVYTWIYHTMR